MCCIDTELRAYDDVTLLHHHALLIEFKCQLKVMRKAKWRVLCKVLHTSIVLPLGLPSRPRSLSSTVQQYGRDSVTLTVQWQPPQYDGGAPVNYTITVSPGLSPVTTSGTSVPVTVPYNVIHTVSIVATNCNGSSSAAMVTIRIGKYV